MHAHGALITLERLTPGASRGRSWVGTDVVGRFGLSDIRPVVGSTTTAEFPARAVVGEPIPVSAVVFREGHDRVAATVVLRDGGRAGRCPPSAWSRASPGTDRWHATVVADRPGPATFTVEAWSDPLSTWHHAVTVKIEAGQGAEDLANDFETGARLFDRLAKSAAEGRAAARRRGRARRCATPSLDVAHRVGPGARRLPAAARPRRSRCATWSTRSPALSRCSSTASRALYGAWYEFFPRSIGAQLAGDPMAPATPARHGTLKDATEHLDYVASLGFDVVYLPPIHPIGEVNRKGPNNTLVAASWDVGSPWAIGSKDGGHDAIHPQLGHDGRLPPRS